MSIITPKNNLFSSTFRKTPRIVFPQLEKNSFRVQQYVISISELIHELKAWHSTFFFYEKGLEDAIRVILSTFEHPYQRYDGFGSEGCSPVMHDVDVYFDAQERTNSLPINHENILSLLELAVSDVDTAVYRMLRHYFGEKILTVMDAKPIGRQQDYVILVRFN